MSFNFYILRVAFFAVSEVKTFLHLVKEFAEDWYLTLRDKNRRGELLSEKTVKQAAELFEREYEIITEGEEPPLGRWPQGAPAPPSDTVFRFSRSLRGDRRKNSRVPHPSHRNVIDWQAAGAQYDS